jgi:F0F1-type ATP synthase alpha subunit
MKKIFVTLCVIYATFSILWNYVLSGINKLILIPIGIAILPILGFYIKAVVNYSLKKYAVEHKKEVNKEKKYNREMQKQEFLRDYDAKIKPLYTEGRNLFNLLMKQRKVHNYEIADLKAILNDRLGKYLDHYHNYKFKNDAHEIYVKMKNFNLNEYDWELILNYIHSLESNEPIKREKKNKEVTS